MRGCPILAGWERLGGWVVSRVAQTSPLMPATKAATVMTGHRKHRGTSHPWGFSLLEMMMVLTLILIAATISQPIYQNMILRAREAALRDTLYTMRSMIDRFTLDNKRPPASLEEMVETGYLGDLPIDPLTRSKDTCVGFTIYAAHSVHGLPGRDQTCRRLKS